MKRIKQIYVILLLISITISSCKKDRKVVVCYQPGDSVPIFRWVFYPNGEVQTCGLQFDTLSFGAYYNCTDTTGSTIANKLMESFIESTGGRCDKNVKESELVDLSNLCTTPITIQEDITSDMTFSYECPYLINGDIHVKNNATLMIEAGAAIFFTTNSSLNIGVLSGGNINAVGSTDFPITFSKYIGTNYKGIIFGEFTGSNSHLDYCKIEYGGAIEANILIKENVTHVISIKNSKIIDSKKYGISISNSSSNPSLLGTTYSNNSSDDIYYY